MRVIDYLVGLAFLGYTTFLVVSGARLKAPYINYAIPLAASLIMGCVFLFLAVLDIKAFMW
jgi:hypothetical protein